MKNKKIINAVFALIFLVHSTHAPSPNSQPEGRLVTNDSDFDSDSDSDGYCFDTVSIINDMDRQAHALRQVGAAAAAAGVNAFQAEHFEQVITVRPDGSSHGYTQNATTTLQGGAIHRHTVRQIYDGDQPNHQPREGQPGIRVEEVSDLDNSQTRQQPLSIAGGDASMSRFLSHLESQRSSQQTSGFRALSTDSYFSEPVQQSNNEVVIQQKSSSPAPRTDSNSKNTSESDDKEVIPQESFFPAPTDSHFSEPAPKSDSDSNNNASESVNNVVARPPQPQPSSYKSFLKQFCAIQ